MAVYTAIDNPELYFQVKTYTGNGTAIGSGGLAVTLDGSEDMQPDFVWIKERNNATNHQVYDAVRGATNRIYTDGSFIEDANSEGLTAFGSNGFTLGNDGSSNGSSDTYVAWCWKESATAGFDILTFDGNETNRTISHSLSAVPHLMILKARAGATDLAVNHQSIGTYGLHLNNTQASGAETTWWQSTLPTSSVFSVGTSATTNDSGESMVAYLWTEKQGFSKFGSYTGNGNADGAFIYTGFKPAWVMIKRTDSIDGWLIVDNKRAGYNAGNNVLEADVTSAEDTSVADRVDILSNGFKLRNSWSKINTSGGTYIYMAFAEAPFVNSNGVPCNAR